MKLINDFHAHKKPFKMQNCAYTYRIEHMSSVWPAYSMASVWLASNGNQHLYFLKTLAIHWGYAGHMPIIR